MSRGRLAEEIEASLAAELREVPHFQLRTAPPFQLNQSIFLSSPTPQSGSHIQNKFPPTPGLLGPSSAPSCGPAAASCPICFWRAGCQARQKSRAGPGPEIREGWKKAGSAFVAFSFLSFCLYASILTAPLFPGPWAPPAS